MNKYKVKAINEEEFKWTQAYTDGLGLILVFFVISTYLQKQPFSIEIWIYQGLMFIPGIMALRKLWTGK